MGGRGAGGEEEAVEGARPGCPPAATGLTNQRREAAEWPCWRRRWRRLLLSAALPVLRGHGGTYARVRAILPRCPDSEGPGKAEGG